MYRKSRQMVFWIMLSLGGVTSVSLAQNATIPTYAHARPLLQELYRQGGQSFYCACPFQNGKPSLELCEMQAHRDRPRAQRVEWEHVVPAARFGRAFSEWKQGHLTCQKADGRQFKGRQCARHVSPIFNRIEADLYNLQPAIGMLNAARGHKQMAMIDQERRAFPPCDFEQSASTIEPRPEIRGDIARTYFYMAHSYPEYIHLAPSEIELFESWSAEDPVDTGECARARQIEALQGNPQPFILIDCPEFKN